MRSLSVLVLACLLGTLGRGDTSEEGKPIYNLCGIGAVLTEKDDTPTITALLRKGPADRAGLKVNDKIVQVDDKNTKGLTLKEAVLLIRGPEGTEVKLVVESPVQSAQTTVTITREPIHVPGKNDPPVVQ